MHFQRLRIAGFKSFVEPVDFRIEPGLTGVVGPNGCGKSNLLEALRWVMGANSAKAMRAEGMDDVIFGGSAGRPARSHAEVRLEIDNSERTAPARFNEHATLEVTRRIDRGAGSGYRVNGAEARARDVQLLFADASTGANSPALVRQGQISELIGAKPSNRRRILEEAAGVSGLHARRHEAGLRLQAAEANLERLGDVHQALDQALARLRREARQAERYKRLSAEIRSLQSAALYGRWKEADGARAAAAAEAEAAGAAVGTTASAAARATVLASEAADALPAVREEAMVAAAVLQRLAIQTDRVSLEAEQAKRDVERLMAERARIASDLAREEVQSADARATSERLAHDLTDLEAAIAAAPQRLPELQAALAEAEAARGRADAEVERLAAEGAAEAARRRASGERAEAAKAAAQVADRRRADAEARVVRLQSALKTAESERSTLGGQDAAALHAAQVTLAEAQDRLRQARAAVIEAEQRRSAALAAEASARDAARKVEDRIGRLQVEARGLAQLTRAHPKSKHPPALDAVTPERGYEAALAAALGDELDAALDRAAAAHWAGADATGVEWPAGATPLAPLVRAPTELAARLARVAVAEQVDGPGLQRLLPIGGRLVSREGDLWRWDGYTVRADAARPAAVRLAQRARLAEVDAEIEALAPAESAAAARRGEAAAEVRAAEEALKAARRAPEVAERDLAAARDRAEQLAHEEARSAARRQALDEGIGRVGQDLAEANAALAASEGEARDAGAALAAIKAEAAPSTGGGDTALQAARIAQGRIRDGETRARAALEAEIRARDGRARRREALVRDQADWRRRGAQASERLSALQRDAATTMRQLATAEQAPSDAETRRAALLDQKAVAETRQRAASDALATAEAAQIAADRALRAADQAAAGAREARAGADARLQAAHERLAAAVEAVRQAAHGTPEVLGRRLAEETVALPPDPAALDAHLAALERERDQLGAVNLLAEEEHASVTGRLETMRRERADLMGAISKLRSGVESLNAEGRERLLAAFEVINGHFKSLFTTLFDGGQAELRLVESDDPLEAGLEIYACPPGKRLAAMSLMSGGEQALTATALIFAVFLAAPAPVCVLDEVDAPLDDANVDRFCRLLDEMRRRTSTRFIAITHNPVTMSRMDRLFGVTMPEPGISQLVSVDLRQAEALAAA